MNPSPEEFDSLRKLIALKKYEQPPPGFFNHFSDKVIARIEAEKLVARPSFWQRLFPDLEAKPVLACAYGLVITGLLVVGLGISESAEPEESPAPNLGSPWFAAQTPAPSSTLPVTPTASRPLPEQSTTASSVVPVFSSSASKSPFDVPQNNYKPVSYSLH